MSDIKWGAEIATNRVKPDFGLPRIIQWAVYTSPTYFWEGQHDRFGKGDWGVISAIRLPADHPYYKTLRTSDEALQRMETFMRRLVKWDGSFGLQSDMTEARAIVALLPKPADPDEVEAEKLTDNFWGSDIDFHQYMLKAIKL